jgi:hypothetical protein
MTEKKSLLSLVERLNIFLRYLELGGEVELKGFRWQAGETAT